MRLIDTSVWIHALRPDGDPQVVARIRSIMHAGEAAWCSMVELELWNGARGDHEKHVIEGLGSVLINLEIDAHVWAQAFALARASRKKGITVPSTDILIAACSRRYGIELEHTDRHFVALEAISV